MTPQEKKALSLERDRRNVYGENSKSSRSAIHDRKRQVNKAFRRAEHQVIQGNDPEVTEIAVANVKRKDWRKRRDEPLGKLLVKKRTYLLEQKLRSAQAQDAKFIERLEAHLNTKTKTAIELRMIMRQCRAVALDSWEASLNLASAQLDLVQEFLKQDCKSRGKELSRSRLG